MLDQLAMAEAVLGFEFASPVEPFEWNGDDAHLAPIGNTPLDERCYEKTNCGLVTLMAGLLLIGSRALSDVPTSRICVRMAEALLCFEADPRAIRQRFEKIFPKEIKGREAAVRILCVKSTAVFRSAPGRHDIFPPVQPLKNLVFVLAHVLGPSRRDGFRDWLSDRLERLDAIAPNKDQKLGTISDFADEESFVQANVANHGTPVPIRSLDSAATVGPTDLRNLYREEVLTIDWRTNPFLSPDLRPLDILSDR